MHYLFLEVQDIFNCITGPYGRVSSEDKLKCISEYTGQVKTLVAIRNAMIGALTIFENKFIDTMMEEYPSEHSLETP